MTVFIGLPVMLAEFSVGRGSKKSPIQALEHFGGSEVTWELFGSSIEEGTYCVDGNVEIGGDVVLSGTPGINDNFDGIVYAHSQCGFDGDPSLGGQVICNDEPEPAGVKNYVDGNRIDGTPTIVSSCDALEITSREILAWMQKVGS